MTSIPNICTQCESRTCDHVAKAPPQLTERHAGILRLLARGKRNRDIASELKLAYGTVKVYLTKVYPRIGVKNRLEAALWALKHEELLKSVAEKQQRLAEDLDLTSGAD